jgi:hypothetical protein
LKRESRETDRAVIHETVGIEQIAETMHAACTVKRADVLV